MEKESLKILEHLEKHKSTTLNTFTFGVVEKLHSSGLIQLVDPINKKYAITYYGKGVLREVHRIGTEAMVTRMAAYIKQ